MYSSMAGKRGVLSGLAGFVLVLAVLAVLAVVAPSYIVRYVVLDYLSSQGLDASIQRVDANLLTGTITVEGARATGPDGNGFQIGHLSLAIAYSPLFDKRLTIQSLTLRGAQVDISRSANNVFSVAGVPLNAGGASGGSSAWQFGLKTLRLGAVHVHYHQAGGDGSPSLDQVITFNQSSTGALTTWHEGDPIPVNAHIGVAGGSLELSGRLSPLGDDRQAHLRMQAHDFPLSLAGPFVAPYGLTRLDGRLEADQRVIIDYPRGGALQIQSQGHTAFHDLTIIRRGGMKTTVKRFVWNGRSKSSLLHTDDQPGEIDTDGRFTLDGLNARQGDTFHLQAAHANWQGRGEVSLDSPLRISTHGTYDDRALRLDAGSRLKLSADSEHLEGDIETTLGSQQTTIVSNGQYRARALSFKVPGSIATDTDTLDWHGTTQTTLAAAATRIDTHGRLDGTRLDFRIPQTSRFTSRRIDWQGDTHINSGDLFVHAADGRLVTTESRLDLPDMPLAFTAQRFIYDGRYAQQPDASGKALKIVMDGEAIGRKLTARNTRLDAPWIATLQDDATGIHIDGIDDIRVGALETSGVRLLGDTDTHSSVVDAVSLEAKNFRLTDLLHYDLKSIKLTSAIVHLRRNAQGMGVISQYFGSAGKDKSKDDNEHDDKQQSSGQNDTGSTFAIEHLGISGPALWFVDTQTDPKVVLHGLDMNFVLDGLDTGSPEKDAKYRLSMDLGAYGHLDSTGTVAPLATDGMNMDIHAWLRSLSMPPLSGYLDQAMGRKISRGAIDGTLDMKAKDGQLNGTLDATLANFRLDDSDGKTTEIALGINMETALALIRGQDDEFHFQTKILGDVTNPYFSVNNLVREAVLAGLRTALLSNYSPVGLANRIRNAFLNLFRSVEDRPAKFEKGKHYIRPEDRHYLALIAQAMDQHLDWTLTVQGQATPADAKALSLFEKGQQIDSENRIKLKELARQREEAVRDYLAARGVSPGRIEGLDPQVNDDADAKPLARFTLDKHKKKK